MDLNDNEKELIKELEKYSKQGEKKYFNGENCERKKTSDGITLIDIRKW